MFKVVFFLLLMIINGPSTWAQGDVRRDVNLEWGEVEGATGYEVEITRMINGQKQKPFSFKLDKAQWKGNIKPGLYLMRLRSFDDRQVPGHWSSQTEFWVKLPPPTPLEPTLNAVVPSEEDDEDDVVFKWKSYENAHSFELHVKSEDGKLNKTIRVEGNQKTLELPVAKKYSWTVTAIMREGQKGESPESSNSFTHQGKQLDIPTIKKPLSKYVKNIKWEKPDRSESYNYVLLRKIERLNKWKLVERKVGQKGEGYKHNLANPPGLYKLRVQAHARHTKKSEISELEYEAAGNLRSPAAIENAILKDSIEKPSSWYGIASYFITSMNYQGQDGVKKKTAKFNAVGGTGRLGAGYQKPNSKIGYFGIFDMSGFIIGGENITFGALELHTTYEPWKTAKSKIRASGGVFLKELPEVTNQSGTNNLESVSSVNSIGVHGGFQYWQPYTETLGWQVNGRLYFTVSGDNQYGGNNTLTASYKFGILGSYRITNRAMGFAGYAYRSDEASYLVDGAATNNRVKLQGHYLNLLLEYSF